MKSFDKFRYGIANLLEVNIGGYMSSVSPKNRVTYGHNSADQRNEISKTKKNDQKLLTGSDPKLIPGADGTTAGVRAQRNKASGNKNYVDARPKEPIAKKVSKQVRKSTGGLERVLDRNKARAKKFANSPTGRKTGRALAGAAKEVIGFTPDKERTDTGQGGMGTGLRAMTGVGQAAVAGAINAPAERINPRQRKTLGGKLLAVGKERLQKKFGVDPTDRTEQGRKVTGDTGDEPAKERQSNIGRSRSKVTGETRKEAEKEVEKEVQRNVTTGGEYNPNRQSRNKQERDKGEKQLTDVVNDPNLDKARRDAERDMQADADAAKREEENKKPKVTTGKGDEKPKVTTGKGGPNPDLLRRQQMGAEGEDSNFSSSDRVVTASRKSKNKTGSIVKAANKISRTGRKKTEKKKTEGKKVTNSRGIGNQFRGAENLAARRRAIRQRGGGSASNESKPEENKTVKLLPPSKTPEKKSNEKKVASYKKVTRKKKFRQTSFLNKKEFKNLKSSKTPKTIQKKINFSKDAKTTKEETDMNLQEMNQIAARRELAKEKGGGKMRTYKEIQQAKLKQQREKQLQTGAGVITVSDSYEYSHWREEFIWETDKKYPDKVKEIKPMTGKNTITINPEDETSKYKRGY